MFQLNDEVIVTYDNVEIPALVVNIVEPYVIVRLESNDWIAYSRLRLYNMDGTGTGGTGMDYEYDARHSYMRESIRKKITVVHEPTPGREYPPEPSLTYGVFDGYYRPITEGYSDGTTIVGFGIINAPAGVDLFVAEDRENPSLQAYLARAKKRREELCWAADFDALDNKFEILVGQKIRRGYVYTDGLNVEVYINKRVTNLTFTYPRNQCVTGIMTLDEVTEALSDNPVITAVEGDIFTLGDGRQFALTSRFNIDEKPIASITDTAKANLMRSLAMQQLERDSQLALAA